MLKNKFAARAKISESDFRKLLRLYCGNMDATRIAQEMDLNRKTVGTYIRRIRDALTDVCVQTALAGEPFALGDVTFLVFPPDRPSRRGEGFILSGVLRQDRTVVAELGVEQEDTALRYILEGRMRLRGWFQRECVIGFTRDLNLDFFDQRRIDAWLEGQRLSLSSGDMVELFLGMLRQRLVFFRGVGARHLRSHLKECEFRFNARGRDLYRELLRVFRGRPLH